MMSPTYKKLVLLPFFSICFGFFSFPIALSGLFSTIVNREDGNEHSYLILSQSSQYVSISLSS